jgi:hypothetical protein
VDSSKITRKQPLRSMDTSIDCTSSQSQARVAAEQHSELIGS